MPVEFDEVVDRITDAARKAETDAGASPVLVAVVREFRVRPTSRCPTRCTRHGSPGIGSPNGELVVACAIVAREPAHALDHATQGFFTCVLWNKLIKKREHEELTRGRSRDHH